MRMMSLYLLSLLGFRLQTSVRAPDHPPEPPRVFGGFFAQKGFISTHRSSDATLALYSYQRVLFWHFSLISKCNMIIISLR